MTETLADSQPVLDSWNVCVSWKGDRRESPEECGQRTLKFLSTIRQLDPCFETFQFSRRVRGKMVREHLPLDLHVLADLFARGVNRRDSDGSVIEELGFSIDLTTPGKQRTSLSIYCGTYDSPWNHNVCSLDLSARSQAITVPVLTGLLRHMVEAFDPDTGLATSYLYSEAVNGSPKPGDELPVGWSMYFSRKWGVVVPLPAPVRIEPVGAQGMLIVLTEECASASVPEHVALGRLVKKLLSKSGILDERFPKRETD